MQELLPDEDVLGAFLGVTGPRPGTEALLIAFGVIESLLLLYGLLAVFGVRTRRHCYTMARTSSALVVIDTGLRQVPKAGMPITRLTPDRLLHIAGTLDSGFAELDGHRYWLYGAHQDEARRLSRLGPTAP